mmetsp:Transcript_3503/g.5573  ORF Transcript_3503/g.5573 Transcript_3503/m.5573 type:complete len:372 (-) Transcript_3503:49-1164(-)
MGIKISLLFVVLFGGAVAFVAQAFLTDRSSLNNRKRALICPSKLSATELSTLPEGISPFAKGLSKSLDVQGDFRRRAVQAIRNAASSGVELIEVEFPPLIGGGMSKSQFDDFDNVQELNKNRDWCIQCLPDLDPKPIWFILPDLKECELAKEEWTGSRFRGAATWTTIEAVTEFYSDGEYSKPWGASIASGLNSFLGGDKGDAGLLGDTRSMDELKEAPKIHLVCQPGNGGPMEDWINVEKIHTAAPDGTTTVVVNGALDKVRDGYYPPVFFPKLGATVDRFYRKFDAAFYLRPLTDKGRYGWLYRVYPEPWQVVLQTVGVRADGARYVADAVVHTSAERPGLAEAVRLLVEGARRLEAEGEAKAAAGPQE